MHKVRMLTTQKGVHDGEIYPATFLEGEEYEIGDELMQSFIDLGAVDLADGDKAGEGSKPGEKSHGNAPANKAIKAAPENKSR